VKEGSKEEGREGGEGGEEEDEGDGGGASLRKLRFFPPSLPVKRARGEKGGEGD